MKHKFQRKRNPHISVDKIIKILITISVFVLLAIFLVPLLYVLIASFSPTSMRILNNLVPNNFVLDGYEALFSNELFLKSFFNSVVYTVVGVIVSMIMTILCAYPLSVTDFFTGKFFSTFFIFTMYFSGGMIPSYLLIKNLGLLDTMWSLILPSCVSVFNIMLLTASFSKNNSKELYAVASLDGCGHWRYLFKVVLPMSKPTLFIIAFSSAASYWNSYFEAMLYITDMEKWPLTLLLRNVLIANQELISSGTVDTQSLISLAEKAELMEYALIVITTIPMIFVSAYMGKHSGVNDRKHNYEQ